MVSQAQGILSKSIGAVSSSSSSIKALVGSHPMGLTIVAGFGAYYLANKYWLNNDEEVSEFEEEASELEEAEEANPT